MGIASCKFYLFVLLLLLPHPSSVPTAILKSGMEWRAVEIGFLEQLLFLLLSTCPLCSAEGEMQEGEWRTAVMLMAPTGAEEQVIVSYHR